jgi:SAM-dependent methyltransferase
MNCNVCNGLLVDFINAPIDYEYRKRLSNQNSIKICKSCKSIQQFPIPSRNELDSLYDISYQNYKNENIILRNIWLIWQKLLFFKFTSNYSKELTILDYGCGDGQFLNLLHNSGYKNLYGYDVYTSKEDITTYNHIYTYKELSNITYDLIRLNHVIEHFKDPIETLLTIHKLLCRNGIVIGQTPNTNSISFILFKKYWGCLHYPYHTIIYDKNSLEILVNKCGFELISTSYSFIPTGWSISIENILKNKLNIQQKGRLKIYPFLIVIGLFITMIEFILTKRTGVMNFKISKIK